MGTGEERPAILYFLSDNGEFQRIGKLGDVTFQCDGTEEKGALEYITSFADLEVTGTVEIPHCHSRKRYVKLLMAEGIGRNTANLHADVLRDMGYSWGKAWISHIFWKAFAGAYEDAIKPMLSQPPSEEEREIKCLQESSAKSAVTPTMTAWQGSAR